MADKGAKESYRPGLRRGGREGGRVRARGSGAAWEEVFFIFQAGSGRAKFLASESSVQHSALITCERSKEAAVMCSSP